MFDEDEAAKGRPILVAAIVAAGILGFLVIFATGILLAVPGIERDLRQRVSDALEGERISSKIILADGRAITLRGVISDNGQRNDIVRVAAAVTGVRRVIDELHLAQNGEQRQPGAENTAPRAASPPSAWRTVWNRANAFLESLSGQPEPLAETEAENTTASLALATEPPEGAEVEQVAGPGGSSRVIYEIEDGGVSIIGVVPDASVAQDALSAARALFGEGKVEDQLTVDASAIGPDWLTQASILVGQLASMPSATVVVSDDEVAIAGQVANQSTIDAIEIAARSLFGDDISIQNLLTVNSQIEAQSPTAADTSVDAVSIEAQSPTATDTSVDAASPAQNSLAPLLDAVPCAALHASTDGGVVELGGYAHDSDRLRALLAQIKSLAGIDEVRSANVQLVPNDMCAVLDVLAAYGLGRSSGSLRPLNADHEYTDGEPLVLDITSPADGAYLYVDYFDLEGNVMHLLPSERLKDNRPAAGNTATIGKAGDWRVASPFGTELIVLLATPEPLFAAERAPLESGAPYLELLQQKLENLLEKHGQDSIFADLAVITTKPKA